LRAREQTQGVSERTSTSRSQPRNTDAASTPPRSILSLQTRTSWVSVGLIRHSALCSTDAGLSVLRGRLGTRCHSVDSRQPLQRFPTTLLLSSCLLIPSRFSLLFSTPSCSLPRPAGNRLLSERGTSSTTALALPSAPDPLLPHLTPACPSMAITPSAIPSSTDCLLTSCLLQTAPATPTSQPSTPDEQPSPPTSSR
jgi:hypothetical protein